MTVKEALQTIQEQVSEVSKQGNLKLKLKCTSAYYANSMVYAYRVIYGTENVGDAEFHFLNTDKYAYPRFVSAEMRDDAFQLTQDLIDGKEVTVTTGSVTVGPGGATDGPSTTTTIEEESDEPDKDTTDWTTYIIIGAAAMAILLLLLDKEK